jgi:hypothetical protein
VQKLFRIPVDVWLAVAGCGWMLLVGFADYMSLLATVYAMISAYVVMKAFSH